LIQVTRPRLSARYKGGAFPVRCDLIMKMRVTSPKLWLPLLVVLLVLLGFLVLAMIARPGARLPPVQIISAVAEIDAPAG
jgi:hypothetical protein